MYERIYFIYVVSHGFISVLLPFRNEGNPLLQIEVEPTSDVSPFFDLYSCYAFECM